MDNVAGLNDASSADILMGVVYGVTAFVLIVVSFILFTRKYRRQKMEAINSLEFITSRYNIYKENAQFMFNVPYSMEIVVRLLDENDKEIDVLVNKVYEEGEHVYNFNVSNYPNGVYFLELKADNVNMLRKIKINNPL